MSDEQSEITYREKALYSKSDIISYNFKPLRVLDKYRYNLIKRMDYSTYKEELKKRIRNFRKGFVRNNRLCSIINRTRLVGWWLIVLGCVGLILPIVINTWLVIIAWLLLIISLWLIPKIILFTNRYSKTYESVKDYLDSYSTYLLDRYNNVKSSKSYDDYSQCSLPNNLSFTIKGK